MSNNKGALELLAEYGGDSSDEEVPGSRVSTKRMHKDHDGEPNLKRFERLPVPELPEFTVKNQEEFIDDPSLHDGRIRSFPHERGNWATYVFIPYETNEGLEKLVAIITKLLPHDIDIKYMNDFHISLTRTVILRHHWIDPFVNTIRENLSHFTKFIVMLGSLEIYVNEEKTRTFMGLKIKTGYDSLCKLVQCFDNCLSEFKLPKFYENPSFHVSIAWCLGDCTEKLKPFLPEINNELDEIMNEYSQENWYIYVQNILCRSGNKLFQFNLT